jgi:hypothetical protein
MYPAPFLRFCTIFAIAVEGALAHVQVERGNLGPLIGERHRHVHGGGGFPGAALLIGENYTMWAGHGDLSGCTGALYSGNRTLSEAAPHANSDHHRFIAHFCG